MALNVEIEKTYGSFHLQVAFQAEQEVLALLGASGCGKSLTLKCIAGIERPDRGRIELDGRVLFDSAGHIDLPPQQRRVGYLFQQYALFPNMTVWQNIQSGAHRLPHPQQKRRTEELVAMFRLTGLERLRPHQLSGGQQQRVALARILASEPAAVLLDEPFSALDNFLKFQLETELQDLLQNFSGTVLWVSHDRGEAYRNCRRVCLLEGGVSRPVVSMEQLLADPGTVGAAQLSGCGNCVPVRPTGDPQVVEIPAWGVSLRCGSQWQEGITHIGIRVGHFHPAAPGEENAIPCQVVRTVEDLSSAIVLLRPEGASPEAPLLRMDREKGWLPPGNSLTVAVVPKHILLLR